MASANDPALAALVSARAAAMTSFKLKDLRALAGDVIGAWGETLETTRELLPVLVSADGKTLLDRAIWVEDAQGGYYTLASGNAVLGANGLVIARPSVEQVLMAAAADGAAWRLEQGWSPSSRGSALAHREAVPYLMQLVDGRAVVLDYGVRNPDGSWRRASGVPVLNAQGHEILSGATLADIVAQAHATGTEWRSEALGFNPYANLPVDRIGVNFIDGRVVDYTVLVTDRDGSFYVWARNLDRALALALQASEYWIAVNDDGGQHMLAAHQLDKFSSKSIHSRLATAIHCANILRGGVDDDSVVGDFAGLAMR